VSQHHNRFGDVPHARRREERLILVDQRDDVASWNVAVVNDREPGPVEVVTNLRNLAGRPLDRIVRT
jgi:hypothetical protein